MTKHLAEIATQVTEGAHAVLAAGGRSRSMPAVDAQRYVARTFAAAVWQG